MNQYLEMLEVERFVNEAVAFAPKVITALLLLFAFWVMYRITRRTLRNVLARARFHETLIHLLVDNIYKIALLAFSLVMAADQLGVNVGAALAGLGVAGIAVGFAAQDSLANLIAGFLIFWDKPFEVGDWITVSDRYGQIREITLRSTRIRTPANTYVVIPNRSMIDQILINHTKHGELRVDVPVGIAYKEYVPKAREVILEAVKGVEDVLAEPAPGVVMEKLGASSVDLIVRVWIHDASLERPVFFKVMEACKLALDAAGIQIPYHHLQLFIDDVEERVWDKMAHLSERLGKGNAAPS